MSKPNYNIDLIKQIAVYDANYIRLLKLVPQLQAYLDKSFREYISDFKNCAIDSSPSLLGTERL